MMAYVFWHTRSEATPQETYERDLLAFYDALGKVDCPGVRRSATFRISSVPWMKEQRGYEDWAVIDGAWVLEGLNTKAIVGSMAPVHASIAQQMDQGNGGLYYHLSGDLEPHRANRAQWLTRPRECSFVRYSRRLCRVLERRPVCGVGSWCWVPARNLSSSDRRRWHCSFRWDGRCTR